MRQDPVQRQRQLGATTRATRTVSGTSSSSQLRTTGFRSRSLLASIQRLRPTHELKTDGTYFVSNTLGGDHSLKFGVGYRRAPTMTFSHYAGGARAILQCNGNSTANCADTRITPARRVPAWCRTAPSSTATRCATAPGGATTATCRTRTAAAGDAQRRLALRLAALEVSAAAACRRT